MKNTTHLSLNKFDLDSIWYFKQNGQVLWRCLFIWACGGLSIRKALHINVWEMAWVTAMAAGGEQTRSAHARDVSLGARICGHCTGAGGLWCWGWTTQMLGHNDSGVGAELARARPAVPLGLWSITSSLRGNLYVHRLHKFIKWFANNDVAHRN